MSEPLTRGCIEESLKAFVVKAVGLAARRQLSFTTKDFPDWMQGSKLNELVKALSALPKPSSQILFDELPDRLKARVGSAENLAAIHNRREA